MDKEFLRKEIRGSIQAHKIFEGRSDEELDAFAEGMAEEIVNNYEMVVRGQLLQYGSDLTVRVSRTGWHKTIEAMR